MFYSFIIASKALGLMDELRVLIHQYPKIALGAEVLFFIAVFNAIVQGMPKPKEGGSVAYQWIYASAHALAMNFVYAVKLVKAILQARKVLPPDTEEKETATAAGKE